MTLIVSAYGQKRSLVAEKDVTFLELMDVDGELGPFDIALDEETFKAFLAYVYQKEVAEVAEVDEGSTEEPDEFPE